MNRASITKIKRWNIIIIDREKIFGRDVSRGNIIRDFLSCISEESIKFVGDLMGRCKCCIVRYNLGDISIFIFIGIGGNFI
jgi:hypothetical protein